MAPTLASNCPNMTEEQRAAGKPWMICGLASIALSLVVSLAAVCYMILSEKPQSLRIGMIVILTSMITWRIVIRYCGYRAYLAAGLNPPRLWWKSDCSVCRRIRDALAAVVIFREIAKNWRSPLPGIRHVP